MKSTNSKSVKFKSTSKTSKGKFVNISKPVRIVSENEKFNIYVNIENRSYRIFCGHGNQTLQWLFNAALHQHSNDYCFISGIIYGYIDENQNVIDTDFNLKIIKKELINNQSLTVLLKREYLQMKDDLKKNKKQMKSSSKPKSKVLR